MIEIINDLDCYAPELLARLPTRFRRQLLHNLPALDLCRLEHSPVAHGVDLNSIWKEMYPPFLKRFDRLPKLPKDGSGVYVDWKMEYFNVVMDYILRNKPHIYVERNEDFKYRYTIVDCLIAVRPRKLLGVYDLEEPEYQGAEWWFKHQTPLIFYETDKVTTKRLIELRGAGKDSLKLLDILASRCHLRPKTFCVDRSVVEEWGQPLLQYKQTRKVLKELLSELEQFCVHIAYTSHNTSFYNISQVPIQITKAIFSNPKPKLASLKTGFSFPGVMEKDISDYMRGFSPIFFAIPTIRQITSVTAKYPHLTKLEIDGNLDKSSVVTLAALIEQQSVLEELAVPNFAPEGLSVVDKDVTPVIEPIVVAFSRVFYKPRFKRFQMDQSHIHPSIVRHIVFGFLSAPCSHKQELLIDKFHITPTLNVRYEKPCTTHPAPSCALNHKFLWPGRGTELKLLAELFPIVFEFPVVRMHTFLVGFFPRRGINILHLAAEHGQFFVTTFILVYITESETLQEDLKVLLKVPTLHTFIVYPYNVQQLGYIANTLQGQPNLLTLSIGGTNPENSGEVLSRIFNGIFSLPQVSDFTLDFTQNNFKISDSDCVLLHECWLETAAGRPLKELVIYSTDLETREVMLAIVRDVAVAVTFVDEWAMFDIGFNN